MALLVFIFSFAHASEPNSKIADSYYVDVEDNLKMRAPADLSQTINTLYKNDPVQVISKEIKKFENKEYVLVRKTAFTPVICWKSYEGGGLAMRRIFNPKDYEKYKKELELPCGPNDEKLNLPAEETEGYVALSYLKTFSRPPSFNDSHQKAIQQAGYRIIEPNDFMAIFSETSKPRGDIFSGVFFIDEYKDNFTKSKSIEVKNISDPNKVYAYEPVKELSNGCFVLHLVETKNGKVRSVFALLDAAKQLKVFKEMDFTGMGLIDEYWALIPAGIPLATDKELLNLSYAAPGVYGDIPPTNLKNFEDFNFQNRICHHLKPIEYKKECVVKNIDKKFQTYKKSVDKIDFALAIFSHYCMVGSCPVYPEGNAKCSETLIFLKEQKAPISTGNGCYNYEYC